MLRSSKIFFPGDVFSLDKGTPCLRSSSIRRCSATKRSLSVPHTCVQVASLRLRSRPHQSSAAGVGRSCSSCRRTFCQHPTDQGIHIRPDSYRNYARGPAYCRRVHSTCGIFTASTESDLRRHAVDLAVHRPGPRRPPVGDLADGNGDGNTGRHQRTPPLAERARRVPVGRPRRPLLETA